MDLYRICSVPPLYSPAPVSTDTAALVVVIPAVEKFQRYHYLFHKITLQPV
jgi:hypothetical protein